MTKVIRWFSYAIAFVVLLLAIAYGVAQLYKSTILETINREVQGNINGTFHVGGLDFTIFERFPNFSLTLSDIYLRGPRYDQYAHDIFTADKIYVHVNPLHLIRGVVDLNSIAIEQGAVYIFRTKDGYINTDVLKPKDGVPVKKPDSVKKVSPLSLNLSNIRLKNTRFAFIDSLKAKSFDVTFLNSQLSISTSDTSRLILLNGPMYFGGLTFNQEKGGYLYNTQLVAALNLEFRPANQNLVIHPSSLNFGAWHVDLQGNFGFASPGLYNLSIKSDQLLYGEGVKVVTRALGEKLSKYNFVAPLKLDVNLIGTLAPGDQPRVDINFSTEKNQFRAGKIALDDLALKGSFSNHLIDSLPYTDSNSAIRLDTVSGKVKRLPFDARISLINLTDPDLHINLLSNVRLTELNRESDDSKLKFSAGVSRVKFNYDGKLKEYLDSTVTEYKGKLNGSITISDAAATMEVQQKTFEKVNAAIHFSEKQLDLDDISFKMNGNDCRMKGTVTGFLPFFFQPQKKGYVNLSVYSPRIDLASISKKKTTRKPKAAKGKSKKKISAMMDMLAENVEFNLDLKADELVSGNFRGTGFVGKLSLRDDEFTANPMKMKVADGDVNVQLKLSELDKANNPLHLYATVSNADVKKFFKSFNNFSMKSIKSENLSGKVSADIRLKATVDDQFNILMPTLDGEVDFKVKDGQLKDFEPLANMSNFLMKNRDFSNVNFAEINCRFKLEGPSLDIARMEVQSTVLTLFLEGKYSLGDSTDITIQVPLSNLKKRDKDYKPENVGVDSKVGPSIYLRAREKDGKIVIAYMPFKKFKKSKN
jgi:hypothetical protein